MRVMLTSCGLETEKITNSFKVMLGRQTSEAKALFIPTAAVNPDAIEVLPKCLNDLYRSGIPQENITVYDMHVNMTLEELNKYDVVYICGGSTAYLLNRMNETGFAGTLTEYIKRDGFVLGVSAGSVIFSAVLPDNLELINTKLSVHCDKSSMHGKLSFPLPDELNLSNNAAMLIRNIPDNVEIIDD